MIIEIEVPDPEIMSEKEVFETMEKIRELLEKLYQHFRDAASFPEKVIDHRIDGIVHNFASLYETVQHISEEISILLRQIELYKEMIQRRNRKHKQKRFRQLKLSQP